MDSSLCLGLRAWAESSGRDVEGHVIAWFLCSKFFHGCIWLRKGEIVCTATRLLHDEDIEHVSCTAVLPHGIHKPSLVVKDHLTIDLVLDSDDPLGAICETSNPTHMVHVLLIADPNPAILYNDGLVHVLSV